MKNKTTSTLYYWVSVLFYVNAVIKFSSSGFSSGVIWLCLGSAFLCIGANNYSKTNKPHD